MLLTCDEVENVVEQSGLETWGGLFGAISLSARLAEPWLEVRLIMR
jgi:hypothetical protein